MGRTGGREEVLRIAGDGCATHRCAECGGLLSWNGGAKPGYYTFRSMNLLYTHRPVSFSLSYLGLGLDVGGSCWRLPCGFQSPIRHWLFCPVDSIRKDVDHKFPSNRILAPENSGVSWMVTPLQYVACWDYFLLIIGPFSGFFIIIQQKSCGGGGGGGGGSR